MSRIQGRLMSLKIDGVNRSGEVSKCTIDEEDGDTGFLSMDDAATGGSTNAKLMLTIAQDLAEDSLHSDIIANAGDTVDIVFAPYRNEVPTADKPHVIGSAVITKPKGTVVGTETTTSTTEAAILECEWPMPEGWSLKRTA